MVLIKGRSMRTISSSDRFSMLLLCSYMYEKSLNCVKNNSMHRYILITGTSIFFLIDWYVTMEIDPWLYQVRCSFLVTVVIH